MMPLENSLRRNKMVAGLQQWTWMCLVIFLLATAGCATETVLERDYGNSWAYNQAVEFANPKAGLIETPAVGLSPKASTNVMEAYNKSFTGKKSDSGSSSMINSGGLTTGSGGGGGSGGSGGGGGAGN
jgi:uncharacterized membrane protein YgcG